MDLLHTLRYKSVVPITFFLRVRRNLILVVLHNCAQTTICSSYFVYRSRATRRKMIFILLHNCGKKSLFQSCFLCCWRRNISIVLFQHWVTKLIFLLFLAGRLCRWIIIWIVKNYVQAALSMKSLSCPSAVLSGMAGPQVYQIEWSSVFCACLLHHRGFYFLSGSTMK